MLYEKKEHTASSTLLNQVSVNIRFLEILVNRKTAKLEEVVIFGDFEDKNQAFFLFFFNVLTLPRQEALYFAPRFSNWIYS